MLTPPCGCLWVHTVWDQGVVTGDLDLVERAHDRYHSRYRKIDENNVTEFISDDADRLTSNVTFDPYSHARRAVWTTAAFTTRFHEHAGRPRSRRGATTFPEESTFQVWL